MKNWTAIINYLLSESTEEEKTTMEQWLAESEENRQYFNKVKTAWQALPITDTESFEPDVDKAWSRLNTSMQQQEEKPSSKVIRMTPTWLNWAASLLVGLGIVFALWQFLGYGDAKVLATRDSKEQVKLADGTIVWVNRNSTLRYPSNFEEKEKREVHLEGEAFFDVAHNPEKPFIIHTGTTKTRVLGTSFNLRSYPEEAQTLLVLATGKVSFSSEKETVTIEPGEFVSFNNKENRLLTGKNNNPNYQAWKQERLIFEQAKFSEVLLSLEQYFNVKIEVSDPAILECTFTNTRPFEQPKLAQLLKIFELANQWEIIETENGYRIEGQGCE